MSHADPCLCNRALGGGRRSPSLLSPPLLSPPRKHGGALLPSAAAVMAAATVLSASVVAGCNDEGLAQVFGAIRACATVDDFVCDEPLHLGAFTVGEVHTATLVLRNEGTGILHLTGAEVSADAGLADPFYPTRIRAQGAELMTMTVTPRLGTSHATIVVDSDDPATPNYEFEVVFEGVGPMLVICPTPGVRAEPEGCSDDLRVVLSGVRRTQGVDTTVLVRNAGTLPLDLQDAEILRYSSLPTELTALTSVSAGVLQAGEYRKVVVRYQPEDSVPDALTANFRPVNPAVAPAILRMDASSAANAPPTAAAVEAVSGDDHGAGRVGVAVWLDGRGSTDPEGDPLGFQWRVTRAPEGSAATIDRPAQQVVALTPDALGSYEFELTVVDSLGQSDTATVALDVQPTHELVVEARWGQSGGDVDLHVLPVGAPLFGAVDCYFGRASVEWGRIGYGDDNPVFRDDQESGAGRERVLVGRPAAGGYDVYVNYFDAHGGRAADVVVDVSRDDGTTPIATAHSTLAATCETWFVGTLQWPDATFAASADAHESVCYPGANGD